jgi:hypothetical protein
MSDDWINYAPLPKVDPENFAILDERNDYLSGEHDKILKSFKQVNEFLENTNVNEIIKRGNQKQSIREIHRVAYLVSKINDEAVLVPRGLFQLDYSEKLSPVNDQNVNLASLSNIEGYLHFKQPNANEIHRFLGIVTSNQRNSYRL